MATELTRDIIERAFDAMGQMAAERGLMVEIAVYGALMAECYPNLLGGAGPTLNARVNAKLDDLMDAYARSADAPNPTWHAGRGPATRPH